MTALAFWPLDVDADLALVHGWMQAPHVAPWWGLRGPPEGVRAHLETQAALAHVDCWIVTDDLRPIAYVETYRVPDDPLGAHYDGQPGDRGFHLLVGPAELLGSGVARTLVRQLVARLLGQPGVTRVVCEPDARNTRMLAFCRALGGEALVTLELPGRTAVLFAWTREPCVAAAA